MHTHRYIYKHARYIYMYVCVEIVDCGKSDKMIKIRGKMDKSDTYKGFSSSDISFLILRISSV